MTKYIQESLAAGIIRLSSSPAGAGFFFVGKKDGSLAVIRPARTEPVPVPAPVTMGMNVLTGERPAFIPFKVNP